ncbi:MAG: hypothetical protein GY869_21635, partial [Planctomycetes bacterium]|nr:hypothetical protein [Planctomycetota bacterium]
QAGYYETGDNKLYIANGNDDPDVLIYGDFATGMLGLGTTSPVEKLDVDGHINSSASYKLDGVTVLSSGRNSVFVGEEAGASNALGHSNSAVGRQALYSNTTGYDNSAMGRQALYSNTIGYDNSAVGRQALYSNTTGTGNSAMGDDALYSNTDGDLNSAMGASALHDNITGSYNSAMGFATLSKNTTGDNNVGVGHYANYYNQTGSNNTAIGFKAGAGSSLHNKSGNVFIGYRAGYNELGDNKLYIANSDTGPPLIYGDFATGNIGLGTINPEYTLDVRGNRIQLKDDTSGD